MAKRHRQFLVFFALKVESSNLGVAFLFLFLLVVGDRKMI